MTYAPSRPLRQRACVWLLLPVLAAGAALGADAPRPKRAPAGQDAGAAGPAPEAAAPPPRAKAVRYGRNDIVAVSTKLRFTTLIVLPPAERILDFTIGDKESWVVDGAESFAYVKAAKEGAVTNLNLVAASGNVYSFLLEEISAVPGAQPDLKVFVEPDGEPPAAGGAPRFIAASEIDNYRRQIELAKEETREVRRAAQAAIDSGITAFISSVRFPYSFQAGKAPFYVRAIYHDDKFTYIQARPEETPALYEVRDGKPNLVNFQYQDGVYVADRILKRGYLAIGKKALKFEAED